MSSKIILPEKNFYSLEEVAEEWGCDISDIHHYAFIGVLSLSVVVDLMPAYAITGEDADRRCIGICTVTGVLNPRLNNYRSCLVNDDETCWTFLFAKPDLGFIDIFPSFPVSANSMPNKNNPLIDYNMPAATIGDEFNSDLIVSPEHYDEITEFEYATFIDEVRSYSFNKKNLVILSSEKKKFESLSRELSNYGDDISEKKIEYLYKTIAVLMRIFIESKNDTKRFGDVGKPNIKQISEAIHSHIIDSGFNETGMRLRALQERLKEALEML